MTHLRFRPLQCLWIRMEINSKYNQEYVLINWILSSVCVRVCFHTHSSSPVCNQTQSAKTCMAHYYHVYLLLPPCFPTTSSCPPCSSLHPPLCTPPSHLSSSPPHPPLLPSPGAETASVPGPLPTDWHAALLCRLAGHSEQSLPAMPDSAPPRRLPAGPVYGQLRCGHQAALCHCPLLSAPSQ